jgi:hypothetical protein
MTTAEFVNCNGLGAGTRLEVETINRQYHIELLGGNAIRISGHPEFCPTPTVGEIQGSTDRSGVVEPGVIELGRYLKFRIDDRWPVTTSRVVKVHVQQPDVH